jgi:hypothetical protein
VRGWVLPGPFQVGGTFYQWICLCISSLDLVSVMFDFLSCQTMGCGTIPLSFATLTCIARSCEPALEVSKGPWRDGAVSGWRHDTGVGPVGTWGIRLVAGQAACAGRKDQAPVRSAMSLSSSLGVWPTYRCFTQGCFTPSSEVLKPPCLLAEYAPILMGALCNTVEDISA